jgi:PKD repeat protein
MYTIRIKGAGSKKIELYSLHQNLSPAIAASSILAPANTTEVVTVGAIPYGQYETGPQEPYSSQGPTNNGRPKPDLCAPDQVATGTAPYTRFAGTSSAAPHVAGAAALLLAQNPSWTEPELRTHLLSETIPMGSPYIYGKGRLVLSLPAPPNQPPTASFTYLPPAPTVGTAVQFNANASHDPDGSIASYLWEFGDGATGSGITTQHTYISAKTYTVRLTVTDNMGASNVAQKAVSVIEAAKPDLLIESVAYSPLSPSVGQSITFTILIRNQGSAAAGSFRVKVQGAVLSTSRSIPQLAAATSTELSLSLPLTQARETFTVTVDDLEQVDEANEGNNSLEKTVEALIPQPLVADAGGPYAGAVGESIDFDGSGSSGAIKQYLWTFGDGSSGQGTHTSHTYNIPDTYTVTLTVTAEGGQHATDSTPVTISPPMGTLSVLLSLPKTSYAIGERITIQYTVNRAAFVYICDVDANGKTTLIFPSYLESNNWVQPGTHSLPSTGYLLQVSGPVGTETLYTFATTRPLPNFPTSFGRGFPVLSTDPPSFLANVRQTMQTQLPSGEWDEHTLSFAVVSTTPTPTTGTLSVTSSPSGASITIDGIPSGTTPKQISVSVGIHTVSFFLPGYQTATRQVTTTAGKVTPLYVPLVREIPNRPPVAAFTASPESPTVLQTIIFDGSTSYDSDGYVVSFTWDFGDGSGASNPVVSHNYSRASSYPVRLTVTDNLGSSHTSMKTIVVRPGSLPPPGGYPGSPPMGGIPGIFVWGTTTWHITINAGSTWTTSRAYRLELRTDGSFQNVNQSTSGGVAPMGIVPSPTQQGKSLLFEGSLQTGNVDYTFTSSAAGSIWMSLKLDIDGDGDLDESTGFIYLRNTMVHPPLGFLFSPGVPFAVKLAGEDVALLPSTNFYVCPSPVYEIKGTKLFLGCRRIKDLEGLP